MATEMYVRRLTAADCQCARDTFALMAEVFDEDAGPLGDAYVARLLAQPGFWALTAFIADTPVGGLTAHVLPMTRSESTELFIYDIAVLPGYQRLGVGRALIAAVREAAAREGIASVFVPADDEDGHAVEFYRALGADAAPVTMFTFGAAAPPATAG